MSELSRYVDELFSKYAKSDRNQELKAEILSNLEAKKADLLSSGIGELEAIQKTKESITNIDFLMDGSRHVYIHQLKFELAQWILIILLVGWILTIPLLIFRLGLPANGIFFIAVLVAGFYYFGLCHEKSHSEDYINKTGFINLQQCRKMKKLVWILWAIFAVISLLSNSALYFGSNLWFSRKVSIDGPYALASLLIAYFVPMLTVIIPIIFSFPVRLIAKYEVGCSDEK